MSLLYDLFFIVLGLVFLIGGIFWLNTYYPIKTILSTLPQPPHTHFDKSEINVEVEEEVQYDPPPEVINPILISKSKWASGFRNQLTTQSPDDIALRQGVLRLNYSDDRGKEEFLIDTWILKRIQRQRPALVIHALMNLVSPRVVQYHITTSEHQVHRALRKRKTSRRRRGDVSNV